MERERDSQTNRPDTIILFQLGQSERWNETDRRMDQETDRLPGQVLCVGHVSVSCEGPLQDERHSGGPEQTLSLLLTPPPPQVTEQDDQGSHEPHP